MGTRFRARVDRLERPAPLRSHGGDGVSIHRRPGHGPKRPKRRETTPFRQGRSDEAERRHSLPVPRGRVRLSGRVPVPSCLQPVVKRRPELIPHIASSKDVTEARYVDVDEAGRPRSPQGTRASWSDRQESGAAMRGRCLVWGVICQAVTLSACSLSSFGERRRSAPTPRRATLIGNADGSRP